MLYKFPKGFLWGSAASAHQVEGNNRNDWSEWEKKNAARLVKEAKVTYKQWQQSRFPQMFEEENYISGRACDHYNRFEEDFDIARELSHNAHRLSIEWSRIEPEEGMFNEKEIEHYCRVIKALRERGLEPFVTLWHWTIPLWLRDKGGCESKDFARHFAYYSKYVVERLKDDVKFWITLNEPAVYSSLGALKGTQPPGEKNIFTALKIRNNLIKAHKLAYKTINTISSSAMISVGNSVNVFISHKNKIYNKVIAKIVSYSERYFFKKIENHVDYIAFQYYRSSEIGLKWRGNMLGIIENNLDTGGSRTDLDWNIYPKGIYYFLKELKKYKLPVYITENGIADADDSRRAQFIKDHLYWVHKAISGGVDVRGYFYWSLIDNFELVEIRGYWPRFGLVEIDYKTMERRIRPSALEYKKIIEDGLEISQNYQKLGV